MSAYLTFIPLLLIPKGISKTKNTRELNWISHGVMYF